MFKFHHTSLHCQYTEFLNCQNLPKFSEISLSWKENMNYPKMFGDFLMCPRTPLAIMTANLP